MLRITTIKEIQTIPNPALRNHIERRASELMAEYILTDLGEIGCFVVLDSDENEQFSEDEMEFVETLHLGNKDYMHGVRIISDNYAEDIYLVVQKGESHV